MWQKAGLQVPRKRPRRRVASQRDQMQRASEANGIWAYDFVFDTCANGQQLKCLTVIEEHIREVLAIDVAGSIRSERVIEVLSRLISERGAPKALRSDNGPEFVSTRLLQWASDEGLQMALSQPPRGPRRHRAVASSLQRGATAFRAGLPDSGTVRSKSVRQRPRGHSSHVIRGLKNRGRSDCQCRSRGGSVLLTIFAAHGA